MDRLSHRPPLFPVGLPLSIGYMGLYRPDEKPTTRDGTPFEPDGLIAGLRLIPKPVESDEPPADDAPPADLVTHPKGWEYLCARITPSRQYREWGWFTEAELLALGYTSPASEAAELELVEAATRQMKCDACDLVGTEENPLVPVESSAAHPEGYVHGAGCPDAGPHHEDAHADSSPVG